MLTPEEIALLDRIMGGGFTQLQMPRPGRGVLYPQPDILPPQPMLPPGTPVPDVSAFRPANPQTLPDVARNPFDTQRGVVPRGNPFPSNPVPPLAAIVPEQTDPNASRFGKIPMPAEFAGRSIGLGPDGFYDRDQMAAGSAVATNDAPPAQAGGFLSGLFGDGERAERMRDMFLGWAMGAGGTWQDSLAMGAKNVAIGKTTRAEEKKAAGSLNATQELARTKGVPEDVIAAFGQDGKALLNYVMEAGKAGGTDPVVIGDKLVDRLSGKVIGDYGDAPGASGYEMVSAEEAQRLGLDPSRPYQRNLSTGKIETIGSSGQTIQVGSKLTETQSKDLGFVGRGMSAFQNAAAVFPVLASPQSYIKDAPGGNYLLSPEYQMADQAGRELLAVILRKDTGAAITDEEMANYGRIYLPQPGDSPEVIQRKLVQAKGAIDSIYRGLGSIGKEYFPDYTLGVPAMPAPPAAAVPGQPTRRRYNPQTDELE